MKLIFKKSTNGLTVAVKNKTYRLIYPNQIWAYYPQKDVFLDNLAHLMTINMPFIAGIKKISYNTALPLFASDFFEMIIRDIPASVDDSPISAAKKIKEFMNICYEFNDYNPKFPSYDENLKDKAIVPLSQGKDSLCTLGVCGEISLNPVTVYINDTISPTENKFKIKNSIALSKRFGITHHIITNEIQKLSDYDYWNKPYVDLGYSHMVTGFCFLCLPLCHYHKAKYIVLGNQHNMNYPFISKEGFNVYPSFDQKKEWIKQQDAMIRLMTNNKANVISVIEPLTNLAITKILYSRYNKLTNYTMSCDCLDASKQSRWCHDCNKCCRLFMMIKAFNFDAKEVGFSKNSLDKKYKKFYALFNGKEVDHYEKSKQARDEQLLAFYLAYKNGADGYLMEEFKKKFLNEAKKREDELYKEFLTIHDSVTMPNKIKNKVFSIYKEELNY